MSAGSGGAGDFFRAVLHGFAAVGALAFAFVVAPQVFEASRSGVFDYAQAHYWDWLAYPAVWLWFVLCMIGSYCLGHLLMLAVYAAGVFALAQWRLRRR